MKIRKILIIGGAGFIGSHLVDKCLQEKLSVWVYDNFSKGKKSFLKNLENNFIIKGDILNGQKLLVSIKKIKPDIVYHLAAIHHIPTCEKYPKEALRVNIEGTQNVLQCCYDAKIKKLVFCSTGALYDPSNTGFLKETNPVKAFDIYSISKLSCEYLIRYFAEKNNCKTIISRLFNTVGPRETNSHLIPAVVNQLISGSRKIILGNLFPKRDYIHVEDVANALYLLGVNDTKDNYEIFNVGTGKEYSVKELVSLLSKIIGEKIEVLSVKELQRKVDRPSQKADPSKLKKMMNWKPRKTLEDALKDIWKEAKKNAK